ncbi:TetR/AcrR family transcriptional regulator [Consotaella salsifontis]|uniref:Transcriptional regulator, TetR family n=1 Tax=Consotaella salsifontis TaxID=1365950 RepID=A0A1T4T726_9HYPH|nr:TetR/AcrR family transcriptional regulator [Consotaella salsifontis]SKA36300.1 transcriptional regulator, TetR family [Consotaella salsifontis]
MDGARAVFNRLGFDIASMNDICQEAGVSKSTLYVYFRSKEELFSALVAEARDRKIEALSQLLNDPRDPARVLRTFGIRLATTMTSDEIIRTHRTIIAVAERMPEIGSCFYKEGPRRGIAMLSDYLAAATEVGALAIDDPEFAASQFGELCFAGHLRRRLFCRETEPPSEAEIAHTVEKAVWLFMKGYGASAKPTNY